MNRAGGAMRGGQSPGRGDGTGPATGEKVSLVCQVIVTVILTAAALKWLQPVVMPLLLAVLISYALTPLLEVLVLRVKLPHTMGVILVTTFGLAVLGGLVMVVSLSVGDLARDADQYAAYVQTFHTRVLNWTDAAGGVVPSVASGLFPGRSLEHAVADLNLGPILARATHHAVQSVLELLSNALLVAIFVVYLLEGRRNVLRGGPAHLPLLARVEGRVRDYLKLKMFVSIANGVLAGCVYGILGIPLAPTFGVLHLFLNLIPTVGPLVAMVIPIPVILVAKPTALILSIALPGAAHLIIGYIVEPTVFKGVELHPISMLLCLIFWGMLWGVPGMFFAVPITVACKIGFESVEVTRPFAELLEGTLHDAQDSKRSPHPGPVPQPCAAASPCHGRASEV